MLRARYATLALISLLCAGYLACTGENAADNDGAVAEAQDNELKQMTQIAGTFRDEGAAGGFAALTLKTDWTYHLEEGIVCVRAPCELPQINGLYKYVNRDGKSILVLMDGRGTSLHQLDYMLRGDVLYIKPSGTVVAWQKLNRSDRPWCGEPQDCALQSLPAGECRGGWSCMANVCSYRCGPLGSEPVFAPTCYGAGCIKKPVIEVVP